MKKILLSLLWVLGLWGSYAYAQNRTITGTVIAKEDGLPIPGVTVVVKGTAIGTQTNANGNFTLSNVPANAVITFSSIGYGTIERTASGIKAGQSIELASSQKQLDEVVVTAAGITRSQASLGVAANTIKSSQLNEANPTNLLNGLTAKAPGLQIGRSSGGVNTAVRVTLRGQRSFSGENQPLFVVDGIPVSNASNQPSGTSGNLVDVGNRIGDINPEDIEAVTVLNGPNAAALYGQYGVNGAIIITTKSGKNHSKKNEVTISSSFGIDKVQKLPTLQNEYGSGYDGEYDPIENTNWGPRLDGHMVQSGPTINPGTPGELKRMIPYSAVPNNAKDFFNTGKTWNNTVAFSGGNDKSSFYTSFSDVEVSGVIPMDKFRRNTVKLSGSSQLNNKFNISGSLQYNRNITNTSFQGTTGATGVYNSILNVSRQIDLSQLKDWRNNPFATPDGFFDAYYPNPYYALENNRFNSKLDHVLGNMQIGFDPFKWLNITYRLGTDITTDNRKQTFERTTYGLTSISPSARPANTNGSVIEGNAYDRIINSDLLITFKKDLNKDFSTTFILLNNIYQRNTRDMSTQANAIAIPGFFNLSNAVGQLAGSESTTVRRTYSFAGDLTLDFRKYLFLNATLRNDNASTLPKVNSSYWYPSASLSYIFTQSIPSLKNSDVFSYGKLRGSFARVGRNADPYNLLPTFSPGSGYPYGSAASFSLSNRFPNPGLKPEFTSSFEVGTELSFFRDKLGLDFTWYKTNSTNQIVNVSTASSTGYTSATINAGELINKGVEVALRANPFSNRNGVSWNFTFSYTHNNSKVNSIYRDLQILPLGTGDPVPVAYVGQQFPVLYGTGFLKDPQGRVVVGANGNPIADPNNQILGQVNPKHILGFTNTISYKGLSLTTVLDYRTGNVIYSNTLSGLIFTGSSPVTTQYNREPFVYPNSVIRNADGSYTPNTALKTSDGGFDFWYSVYNQRAANNIVDAAFLKLRTIELAYQLPKKWLDSTPIGRVTVALTGSNILLWTPKSNNVVDPEVSGFGTSNSQGRELTSVPSTRYFGLNLRATF
ncbi:SusC/RagA family TonB-linked outer membrane protein [Mucilaginibacter sp. KACC 22063]|uniref:SusC/RagA family TonB-linked outer membrane protein n=1 Tax=Mucilaginibacter sp. KACC 22063 TaxID=3025666 RepID=UPI002365C458|nr:SusC/RagA family TonB-linked outer membrane protein [Mucilaginibacter sp. KACC 22063]WDF55270.1 SusC/RagA family TonB-linked outer membrane protein [Mucilaginibacter sp. KACC 22063]